MAEPVTKTIYDTVTQTITKAPGPTERPVPSFTTTYGEPWTLTGKPQTVTHYMDGWDLQPTAVVKITYPPPPSLTDHRPSQRQTLAVGIAAGLGIALFLTFIIHLAKRMRKAHAGRHSGQGVVLDGADDMGGYVSPITTFRTESPILGQQTEVGRDYKAPPQSLV